MLIRIDFICISPTDILSVRSISALPIVTILLIYDGLERVNSEKIRTINHVMKRQETHQVCSKKYLKRKLDSRNILSEDMLSN